MDRPSAFSGVWKQPDICGRKRPVRRFAGQDVPVRGFSGMRCEDLRRNVFLLGHAVENVVAPFQIASRIIQRGKSVRVFDQGGDGGGLPGGQIRRLFAEVAQGSGPDAVKPTAEVNAVQVKFQNLVLAVPFRNAARQRYFHEFAAKAALIPGFGTVFQVIRISGKLLGDGGGALVGVPAVVDILPPARRIPRKS